MDLLANAWNMFTDIGSKISGVWNLFSGERNRQDSLNTQAETWKREDSAVQRRMEDMKKAGLNPLLAAGSPAQSSSPVIAKGAEIDPNDFLAPLQAKLLGEQIGVTTAQKNLTLAQLPGVVADSDYKAYENKTLQENKQLKTDTIVGKTLGEVRRGLKPAMDVISKKVKEYSKPEKIQERNKKRNEEYHLQRLF